MISDVCNFARSLKKQSMKKHVLLISILLFPLLASAQATKVEDIRIEGLQRVSAGSVFNALPVRVGDLADEVLIQDSIRALFRTGLFEDIQVSRQENVLIIFVAERPAISEINLEGNEALPDEALFDSLSGNGLTEGQILRPAALDGITKAIGREYVAQGLYGSNIETNVRRLPRNRAAIDITIDEGDKATIKGIQIVGNEKFDDDELLDLFDSSTGGLFSFFTSNNKYEREKLSGDLERLESFYLDRGYVQFNLDSSQVSLSSDKSAVFITINITEGDVYKVNEVGLLGDTIIDERVLERFLVNMEGRDFSQATITGTKELLATSLGNEGYTFAEIEEIVDVNEEDQTVDLTFFIDPKQRVYVRRVEFRGNTRTEDEVLRREMRQLESAIASNRLVEAGRVRLNRLGFFSSVNSETVPVPGTGDQIDVLYTVEEQSSGSINASLGFAQNTGLVVGVNLSENNFLGSGNSVALGVNRSGFQESLSLSWNNPFFTPDGVSAGFSVFARATDFGDFQVASFTTDSFGATFNAGYPISEISRINFSVGYENLDVESGFQASDQVQDFVGDGSSVFDQFKFELGWVRSTLNRGIFPTRGSQLRVNAETAVPGSGAPFYKLVAEGQKLIPIAGPFTLKLSGELGFGESFESDLRLPFFENFFAGGFGSVRGFEVNTLGPRESFTDDDGNVTPFNTQINDPIGGNVLAIGRAEVLLPVPFIPDSTAVQASVYFDAGNVFDTACSPGQELCFSPSVDELRYSSGIAVTWLSGFGPLSFALGRTFNAGFDEETEVFQFSIGQTF